MRQSWHSSLHGIRVLRSISKVPYRKGLDHLLRDLDTYRGIYLSSGYEYPGRYSRWDVASVAAAPGDRGHRPRDDLSPAELARRNDQ